MIKIENTEVVGLDHAIRGMRNPMNSWDKSDSYWNYGLPFENDIGQKRYIIGENDMILAQKLNLGGSVHAKYRRMIVVYADVTAPLYWWKEYDTYKVGTVANSCSTMHKIHSREITMDDFSYDHMDEETMSWLLGTIKLLNKKRKDYIKTKDKKSWYSMIQILPESYMQKRTIMLNYEVLTNIYASRKDHKQDEWRQFCEWIKYLPYFVLITGKEGE